MCRKQTFMTKLGEYLHKRSINRAAVSRNTSIRTTRLYQLANNANSNIKADELYLIAKAIAADPCELLQVVCGHLDGEINHLTT